MIKNTLSVASDAEHTLRDNFIDTYENSPIPPRERLYNLGLYMNRQSLSRVLFLNEIYQKIVPVNGVIMEFGVRWGQTLTICQNLRGIYEPYNFSRKIIGFDTFSGFPSVHDHDKPGEIVKEGGYSVSDNYADHLQKLMAYHEKESPLSHINKHEIVQGDATQTLQKYLEDHPETIVAAVFFDFDIYHPTKECLKLLLPYLNKGAIMVFDELNHPTFPGETVAMREVFGNNYKLVRSPHAVYASYMVHE